MISSNLVFVQLAQVDDYICIVELAVMLEDSVSQVRHRLKELGDRVECNDKDEWRIAKNVIPSNLLSEVEKVERDSLECTVQQAFFIAGKALKDLRDKKLYRETHSTFESYVRDRFDFTKRAAYYLIDAAEVVENLKSEQFVHSNKRCDPADVSSAKESAPRGTILPTKESQCRDLAGHPPEIQRRAWGRAVELAGDSKVPPARLVKQAVREITQSDDSKQNSVLEVVKSSVEPSFREVNYTAGIGVGYTVRFDEETYYRLQAYQDKIGSATKSGAVARLLDAIAEQE
jgi:hypothetical protein